MYCSALVRTTTLSRNAITQSPLGRAFSSTLLAGALALFTSSQTSRAVIPAPDGGYPNGNTAEGANALSSLTTGQFNTANGFAALLSTTSGGGNTASGVNSLVSNTSGFLNTASGVSVLFNNTTGDNNTANGFEALFHNTAGSKNTASGVDALFLNKTGEGNTAEGGTALENNTGSFNTALGFSAGANLTTGHDNVDIQALGIAGESNTIRIGTAKQTATFITGIHGVTVPSGVGVVIDSNGKLGTMQSSVRFKQDVKSMDKVSEALLKLKPVTFRYKEELDPDKIPQFGLIAEEVEKVDPDLVVRNEDGKVMTVRYDAVNAMLLNEFLKEHRKVADLEKKVVEQGRQKAGLAEMKSLVARQDAIIAQQQKQLQVLTAGLQKVTAQIQAANATTWVVSDN